MTVNWEQGLTLQQEKYLKLAWEDWKAHFEEDGERVWGHKGSNLNIYCDLFKYMFIKVNSSVFFTITLSFEMLFANRRGGRL